MTLKGRTGLLVAYDDTGAAHRAAEFAAERAATTGEPVTVVHVGADLTEDEIRERIGEAFAREGVALTVETVAGGGSDDENVSVAARLAEIVADNDFEMVVMGNEKHGLFHGLIEASVSNALIEDQTIPILLVP